MKTLQHIVVAAVALSATGCATVPGHQGGFQGAINDTFNNPDPCSNNARNAGVLIGGIAGTFLGAKVGDKDKGAMLAGALLGGTIGGLIGADIDDRRCAMAKVAQEYQLQMQFAAIKNDGAVISDGELQRARNAGDIKKNSIGNIVSLQDQAGNGGHFQSNSAVLTERAERYFSAIADIYNLNKAAEAAATPADRERLRQAGLKRKLLLVGHTDDTGSSALNATLSEQRARAVAEYLERRGIPRDQMYYQGAGEVYPVADNRAESGRLRNRRVEIVELADQASMGKYLEARRPNYQFYRTVPAAAPAAALAQGPAQGSAGSAGPAKQAAARAPKRAQVAKATPPAKPAAERAVAAARTPAKDAARTVPRATAPAPKVTGAALDFGGVPLTQQVSAAPAGLGKLERERPLFSLISSAYADDDMAVLSDCSQDRPRSAGGVKALKDGSTYRVNEHVPGLYGKTWTERVNGHQIVINKVAVLASEATLTQVPEFKVYANYDPGKNRNPAPNVSLRPAVNTYLGETGILYRIFAEGAGGMQCVDIVYSRGGSRSATGGNIVYARNSQLFVSPFKPVIAN
ncbi:OmpA family protein [Telluria beijingensis]|uniref:OmpA family protein n=1 Tax=Telluria beijingensis TaxID=3068633 RepID=UPI0027956775|nr:OmpA family protein [Massilia sp. REN29]